jgi:hypothetical protein
MVWTVTGGPEMPRVVVKATMFFVPAIGIAMGVVIWVGLDTQGVKGQDKAQRQDNAQPSSQVHSLILLKIILPTGFNY